MHGVYRFLVAAVAAIAASESPGSCRKLHDVRLPDEHMGPFFRNNPDAARRCQEDASCPFKHRINGTSCWGYEVDCLVRDRYSPTKCPEDSAGWASNKQQQEELFLNQGDFGFIRERKKTLSILCRPHVPGASLLECVRHMELCRAKNIRLDFQRLLHMNGPVKHYH
ncbi:hypothetical protein V5799_023118 [Amblyomma americanum]|uniref:Uncharacterized protein n=1 Tax=Amblyomma americanum TaxID=6943 RepID=A0AAQ4FK28_AMBAM